jgi:hypothetical protein
MRSSKSFGIIGLAITFSFNLLALFVFRLRYADFFTTFWWGCWAPAYLVWTAFAIKEAAKARKGAKNPT